MAFSHVDRSSREWLCTDCGGKSESNRARLDSRSATESPEHSAEVPVELK